MIDHAFLSNLLAWSVQVGLLTAAAALTLTVLRVAAPSIRHTWWRAVLALCLALPLLQPWQARLGGPVEDFSTESLQTPGLLGLDSRGSSVQSASLALPPWPHLWPAALAFVLLGGAAVRFAWLGAGILRLRRLRGAGERAEPSEGQTELQKLTEAGAEIRYVKVIGQPVTFGLRRPIVLLPESLRSLPESVQRAVLAHELWHVRRRDWAWILAEECVRAALWFHPAIWFLVSRVQSSREEVVDELTVLLTNSRRSYLEALLAFADEPPLFGAAPFAKRRHLFQRMLLISKEAVMSSRRIVATSAAMVTTVVLTGWSGAAAFPLVSTAAIASPAANAATLQAQAPPRDARPGEARPATARELELQEFLAKDPNGAMSKAAYFEVAKLQEARLAVSEAEATLQAARAAFPNDALALNMLARFYTRTSQFDRAVGLMEEAAALDPSNPQGHHVVATFYQEKVQKDPSLTPTERLTYIQKGIDATDRALAINPEYVEAMIYKNILLRHQANIETDPSRTTQLIAEADVLRNKAMEIQKTRGVSGGRGGARGGVVGSGLPDPPPPPPPPPPPLGTTQTVADSSRMVDGQAPVRVGGNIKPPVKLRDVRPLYPPDAMNARVQGVVIIEATIDAAGMVRETRVLRSIPMLDQAAVDAVQQWQFAPTYLNGEAVPVIMTVTVNFTLQ